MTSKAKLRAALFAGSAVTAAVACGGGSTGTTGATTGSTGAGGGKTTSSSVGSGGGSTTSTTTGTGGTTGAGTQVFLILMENHNWVDIKGSTSAPFINGLLATGAHAEQYKNPPNNHPSEPNYLWLEAGSNLGIANDLPPSFNHQSTTAHLVTQLEKTGHTWKTYQEGISGTDCPLTGVGKYAPKHNPMIFFDDVTDSGMTTSQHCIKHVRPYPELAADLTSDKIANYNFITPDLCNDMHGDDPNCGMKYDGIKAGDTWLASEVPKLLASKAYMNGATVIITWDEGELSDGPIGMIMLGKSVKVGFSSPTAFDHSSMVRTMQDIFGLKPYLGGAATATNLSELFTKLP